MNKYEQQPDFILDLHGYTTREAGEVLEKLITEGKYSHVRIITGKATFRENGPVLKNFVERTLRKFDIRYETAKLYNGGEGALEIYLDD